MTHRIASGPVFRPGTNEGRRVWDNDRAGTSSAITNTATMLVRHRGASSTLVADGVSGGTSSMTNVCGCGASKARHAAQCRSCERRPGAYPCPRCERVFLWATSVSGHVSRSHERDLDAMFWANVDRRGPGECWEWRRRRDVLMGYGRTKRAGQKWMAHRLAWTLANGPIPDGLWVLHHCDNPPCCNPAHLYVGTAVDNGRDMAERGRAPGGGARPRIAALNASRARARAERIAGMRAAGQTWVAIAPLLGMNPKSLTRYPPRYPDLFPRRVA